MNVLHEGLDDDKYAPADLLKTMVAEGKLGRKSRRLLQVLMKQQL